MIRLLVADDHAIVRSGLIQIFATTDDIAVAGEASQSCEVFEQCRQTLFDLLLLDMSMPSLGGVELCKRLHQDNPNLPILFLSMHNESPVIVRALKAGAAGYVTKNSKPDILLTAIRKVAAGGRFLDPALVESFVFDAGRSDNPPHELLSERELQVLKMIASGYSLGKIAERLHLSPKTISTHKIRLMQKLEIDNNADLFRYAIRHQLAPD